MPSEDEKTPGGAGGNAGGGKADEKGEVTLSQAQLDRRIQSEVDRRVQQALKDRTHEVGDKDQQISDLEQKLADSGKSQEDLLSSQKDRIHGLQEEVKALKKSTTGITETFETFFNDQVAALGEEAQAKFTAVCPEGLDAQGKISLLGKLQSQKFFGEPPAKEDPGDGEENEEGEEDGAGRKKESGGVIPRRAKDGAGSGVAGKEGLDRAAARRGEESPEEGAPDPWQHGSENA